MTNKQIKRVLTEQEEWEIDQLADIFVEGLLYELQNEYGYKDVDSITFKLEK